VIHDKKEKIVHLFGDRKKLPYCNLNKNYIYFFLAAFKCVFCFSDPLTVLQEKNLIMEKKGERGK